MNIYTARSPDDNVACKFIDSLEEDIKDIDNKFFKFPSKMIFANEDKIKYSDAKTCHICEKDITQNRIVWKGQAAHSPCGKKDSDVS